MNLYYKQRRAAEHKSGTHSNEQQHYGINYKNSSEKTRDYGTGANLGYRNRSDEIPRNAEDKKYIDNYNRSSAGNVDSIVSDRKNARKHNKMHPERAKKSAQAMRKLSNESASIFDGAFQAID